MGCSGAFSRPSRDVDGSPLTPHLSTCSCDQIPDVAVQSENIKRLLPLPQAILAVGKAPNHSDISRSMSESHQRATTRLDLAEEPHMATEATTVPDLKAEAPQRPSSSSSSASSRPRLRHNRAYTPPATTATYQPPSLDSRTTPMNQDSSVPIATRFSRASDAYLERNETGECSRSRSRSRGGEYEPRRSSARDVRRSSIWSQDKEKKNRSLVRKLLDHHWVPTFLG